MSNAWEIYISMNMVEGTNGLKKCLRPLKYINYLKLIIRSSLYIAHTKQFDRPKIKMIDVRRICRPLFYINNAMLLFQ